MNHPARACAAIAGLLVAPWITVWFSPIVLVVVGSWGLRAWARRVSDDNPKLPLIVTILLFLHVVFTTVLFAASYFEWPLFSNLQLGGGFWGFAPDADGYHLRALRMADALRTGATLSVSGAADAYGLFVAGVYVVFGALPLNAALVNCWFIVAAGLLAYTLAARVGSDVLGRYVSLVVVACWPSGFVWASQILRDSSALFLTFAALTSTVLILDARSAKWLVVYGASGLIATLGLTTIRNYAGWLLLAAIFVPLAAAVVGILPRDRIRQTSCALLLAGLAVVIGSGQQFWTGLDHNIAAARALPPEPPPVSRREPPRVADSAAATSTVPDYAATAETRPPAPAPVDSIGTTSTLSDSAAHRGAASPGTSAIAPATESHGTLEKSFNLGAMLRLVPRSFEQKRREFLIGSNATLDGDANLTTWPQLLKFLPKGMANALFAPYPWDLRAGASTGIFKVFAILETLLVIAFLLPLLLGLASALKSPTVAAAVPLIFGLFMLAFVGVLVPNVGGLVRLRSQAILPLLTVAFANAGIAVCARVLSDVWKRPRHWHGLHRAAPR